MAGVGAIGRIGRIGKPAVRTGPSAHAGAALLAWDDDNGKQVLILWDDDNDNVKYLEWDI